MSNLLDVTKSAENLVLLIQESSQNEFDKITGSLAILDFRF